MWQSFYIPPKFGVVHEHHEFQVHFPVDASYILAWHLTRFGLDVPYSGTTVEGCDFCIGVSAEDEGLWGVVGSNLTSGFCFGATAGTISFAASNLIGPPSGVDDAFSFAP